MSILDGKLAAKLEDRKQKGRFRQLREFDPSPPSHSGLIDFSSNDYLSLTTSTTLRQSYLDRLGTNASIFGSTGSRLLSGSTPSHTSLENRFARFFDSPAALLFNSGWDANVSFFSTVPQETDWVIYDELVHASVHSGLRAGRIPPGRRKMFRHNDVEALKAILVELGDDGSMVFLALESLYSMDGDLAPLGEMSDVLDDHIPRERQCVVLDEAHSTGVYGAGGRGIAHLVGVANGQQGRVGVRLMTFGKAVGCSGAVLLCSPTIRSFLINFARPLIFSTALPHSTLISLECAWDLLDSDEGESRRTSLFALTRYLYSILGSLLSRTPSGILHLPPTVSSIAPSSIMGLLTPTPHALSAFLLEKGFIIRPVVPPTVPPGGERIRICLRAGMQKEVLRRLVGALDEWVTRCMKEETRIRSSHSVGGMSEVAVKARL